MSNCFRLCALALSWLVLLGGATPCPAQPIDLKNGDRVIFLGGTLIERDAEHGYLETFLTACYPGENLVFRNLGWSGDTVWAEARAGFDTPADGFRRMHEQIAELAPSWIVVAYGGNESFAGEERLGEFVAGLNGLLDALGSSGAKIALVTPHLHESLGAPLPSADERNHRLLVYAQAVRDVAAERRLPLIDLAERLVGSEVQPITENGIHLSDYGYWRYAQAMAESFRCPVPQWRVELSANEGLVSVTRTRLTDVEVSERGARFTALDATLPAPLCPICSGDSELAAWQQGERTISVAGLADGRYELRIDGQVAASGTADDWSAGIALIAGPEYQQVARLRDVIAQKNEFYFHRWRPQNDTYLLGFRKYEQGQNAIEIPQFDPLIAEREAVIARLRRPMPHRYELVRTVRPAVEADPAR